MHIIQYPHPTLRHKSKTIRRVDDELKEIVSEMFQLMYAARGIGLAANQVDLPLQLFVINTTGDPETGTEMVFMNPVISQLKGTSEAEEGCLSLPGVNGHVARPEKLHVSAYNMSGEAIEMDADGLLARAIQHEYDHLQGVMFIDRVSDSTKKQIAPEIDEFLLEFDDLRRAETIPDDETIKKRLAEIEARYC